MSRTLEAGVLALARAHGLFADGGPTCVGSGPGRVDVMGGIADYSGSLVLQLPSVQAAHVYIAGRTDRNLCVLSVGDGAPPALRRHELALDALLSSSARGYPACRALFGEARWAAYVFGVLAVLIREHGARVDQGFDILLTSSVPEAKGLSSSAAVEVAAGRAFAAALDVRLAPRDLALACQRAENEVVGAACGVMDQMASACGQSGKLLRLLCQPAEIEGYVDIPAGYVFHALDSGVRHAVSGADYTSVRVGAFMGWRILADLLALPVQLRSGRAEFRHPQWGSHLANMPPSVWLDLEARVPVAMSGATFLARYGATSDAVAPVEPERTYAVREPTAHPIHEHHRVRTFAALLPHAREPGVAELLGELMYQSHASYTACGLGHPATDALVSTVRAAGPAQGLFGAKVTGGGSGGTVVVFARADTRLPPGLAARSLTI